MATANTQQYLQANLSPQLPDVSAYADDLHSRYKTLRDISLDKLSGRTVEIRPTQFLKAKKGISDWYLFLKTRLTLSTKATQVQKDQKTAIINAVTKAAHLCATSQASDMDNRLLFRTQPTPASHNSAGKPIIFTTTALDLMIKGQLGVPIEGKEIPKFPSKTNLASEFLDAGFTLKPELHLNRITVSDGERSVLIPYGTTSGATLGAETDSGRKRKWVTHSGLGQSHTSMASSGRLNQQFAEDVYGQFAVVAQETASDPLLQTPERIELLTTIALYIIGPWISTASVISKKDVFSMPTILGMLNAWLDDSKSVPTSRPPWMIFNEIANRPLSAFLDFKAGLVVSDTKTQSVGDFFLGRRANQSSQTSATNAKIDDASVKEADKFFGKKAADEKKEALSSKKLANAREFVLADLKLPAYMSAQSYICGSHTHLTWASRMQWLLTASLRNPIYKRFSPIRLEIFKSMFVGGWETYSKLRNHAQALCQYGIITKGPVPVLVKVNEVLKTVRDKRERSPEDTTLRFTRKVLDVEDLGEIVTMTREFGGDDETEEELEKSMREMEKEVCPTNSIIDLIHTIRDEMKDFVGMDIDNPKGKIATADLINELACIMSFSYRSGADFGFPSPDGVTGAGGYATKEKIKRFEHSDPDTGALRKLVAHNLRSVRAVTPDARDRISLMKGTSSGPGTSVTFETPGEIKVGSDSLKADTIKLNVKNVTMPFGGQMFLSAEVTRLLATIDAYIGIGFRDDLAKVVIRLIYLISSSVLLYQQNLTKAYERHEKKLPEFKNESSEANKFKQIDDLILACELAGASLANPVPGEYVAVERADFPKYDNHLKDVMGAILDVLKERAGPFKNYSDEEAAVFGTYLQRFLDGEAIALLKQGDSQWVRMVLDSATSGEGYTTKNNSFIHYTMAEAVKRIYRSFSTASEASRASWEFLGAVPEVAAAHALNLERKIVEIPELSNDVRSLTMFKVIVFGDDGSNGATIVVSSDDREVVKAGFSCAQKIKAYLYSLFGMGVVVADVGSSSQGGTFLNNTIILGCLIRRIRGVETEKYKRVTMPTEQLDTASGELITGNSMLSYRLLTTLFLNTARVRTAYGRMLPLPPANFLKPTLRGRFFSQYPFPFNPIVWYCQAPELANGSLSTLEIEDVDPSSVAAQLRVDGKFKGKLLIAGVTMSEDLSESLSNAKSYFLDRDRLATAQRVDKTRLPNFVQGLGYEQSLERAVEKSIGDALIQDGKIGKRFIANRSVREISSRISIPNKFPVGSEHELNLSSKVIGFFSISHGQVVAQLLDGLSGVRTIFTTDVNNAITMGVCREFLILQMIWGLTVEDNPFISTGLGTGGFSPAPIQASTVARIINEFRSKRVSGDHEADYDWYSIEQSLFYIGFDKHEIERIKLEHRSNQLALLVEEYDSWRSATLPELPISRDLPRKMYATWQHQSALSNERLLSDIAASTTINESFAVICHFFKNNPHASVADFFSRQDFVLCRMFSTTIDRTP